MATDTVHKINSEDSLQPEIREFQNFLAERRKHFPAFNEVSIDQYRKVAEDIRAPLYEGGPDITTKDLLIPVENGGSIKAKIYYPQNPTKPLPCLFYIHGGGWVMFSVKTHDRLMREYASRSGVCVIGIDYNYAPEHRFPSQIVESLKVISWVKSHAAELSIDISSFAIGGDSAGANLTVATALALAKRNENSGLKGLVLNYGVFDARCNTPSYDLYSSGKYMLDSEEMTYFWDAYLGNTEPDSEYVYSPIEADVSALPSTYMAIADHDVLVDDNIAMRDKLEKSGVPVKAEVFSGTVHGFLEAVRFGGVAEEAIAKTAKWLKSTMQL